MKKFTLSLFTFLLISSSVLLSQRRGDISYATLANRASTPNFFIDAIVIPTENTEQAKLIFIFKMENSFLPFKKLSVDDEIDAPETAEFYSMARLNTEIFKGKASKKELKNIAPVSRDLWQDTLFANNYEDTKSKMKYASGRLVTELDPGMYNYVLQLSLMDETDDRNSQRRSISIKNFATKNKGEIYLIKSSGTPSDMELINMGNNVIYGEDYKALIRIPDYSPSENYKLVISKSRIEKNDTTNVSTLKSIPISADRIFTNSTLSLLDKKETALSLDQNNGSFSYALVDVPNSEFENALYSLELKSSTNENVQATKVVRSYWPDIPPSLLNLDIALDMMKYIVSEEQLKNLKSGNSVQKEENFRSFWSERDPTPETEFNELMTEYYRRVHYAFVEYRSPETPNGQDTDRGEVYIKYGPPNSRNRAFPKKGKVIETWTYNNRTFVFEKGSGFSEFMLVGK
jgi:GWxTD domain-containing protein